MKTEINTKLTLVANLGVGQTGKTVGYKLLNGDGTTFQARTTTGVTELQAGTGIYRVELASSVFTAAFDGYVLWDVANAAPYTAEDLSVTDRLDAAVSTRSTYAGGDTAGTTTLLSRLTSGRAGNLDAIDATISSRLPTSTYLGPDNTDIAAIKAKTDLITSGTPITLVSPVATTGNTQIVQGDDYRAADGRALQWTSTSWPVLTSATITLYLEKNDGSATTTHAGTVLTASSVQVELTATDTTALTVGGWQYAPKATLADTHVVTLVTGSMLVQAQP